MRRYIHIITIIAVALGTNIVYSQNGIYDVITLKNDKGVIKGTIVEQSIGSSSSITIDVVEAYMRYNVSEIENGEPSKEDDDTKKDKIVLIKEDRCLTGEVYEMALGKWYRIKTRDLDTLTISFNDIDKLSKELVDSTDNIFEECGLLDVLSLKNEVEPIIGVIVDQHMGKSVTVKDLADNINKIIPLNDITKISKVGYGSDDDLFKYSLYVDEVVKKQGGRYRGIITTQIPGESIIVQFPSEAGFSDPIQYSDITKIKKIPNTYRDVDSKKSRAGNTQEPDSLGWFTVAETSYNQIDVCQYELKDNEQYITLKNYPQSADSLYIDKDNNKIIVRIKAESDRDMVISSIKVWNVETKGSKKNVVKYIDTKRNLIDLFSDIVFEAKSYGDSSIEITVTPNKAGEYAFTYCENKEIVLFNVR